MSRHLPVDPDPAPNGRRPRALVMAALLAFATLTTAIEAHPHREVLGAGTPHHASGSETVSLGASHPDSAPHAEASRTGNAPACPVCLLHLQSVGALTENAGATVAPPLDGGLTPSAGALRPTASRLPGGSRAPPTSR